MNPYNLEEQEVCGNRVMSSYNSKSIIQNLSEFLGMPHGNYSFLQRNDYLMDTYISQGLTFSIEPYRSNVVEIHK